MNTTFKEFKEQIVDMGFEEDEILNDSEYGRVIRNAVNRAQDVIYTTVALQIENFLLLYDNDWEMPEDVKHIDAPTKITTSTKDTFNMPLSTFLMPLLPLLTAYYVWLDDDINKATMYYNQYDTMKNELLNVAMKPRMATIEGGF